MGANVQALDPPLPYTDRGNGDTHVNMYTFGTTWTINSTTVLDATYGISRMTHETTAGDFRRLATTVSTSSGFRA